MSQCDIDYGKPLRVFYWLQNSNWISREGTILLLGQFVDIVNAACGKNEPCATDGDLVYALAPLVRLAARNKPELLLELRETAQALLVGIETQQDPVFRVDYMSPQCAELCGVAINALFLLYAPPKKQRGLRLVR